MANILDRYGIKEVADVTFYEINSDGSCGKPVLYLDSLKVSTIEQTGEMSDARGGKGNPKLITWDFGKEINLTLEDALFSAKSMAVMFGNGTIASSLTQLKRTIQFNGSTPPTKFDGPQGKEYAIPTNVKYYDATGSAVESTALTSDGQYFATFDMSVTNAGAIEVSANSFPGTYYVTGDKQSNCLLSA